MIHRGREPERSDGNQRRAYRVQDRHPRRTNETQHDEKAAADFEEPGEVSGAKAVAETQAPTVEVSTGAAASARIVWVKTR